jgi:hypothetical protein
LIPAVVETSNHFNYSNELRPPDSDHICTSRISV